MPAGRSARVPMGVPGTAVPRAGWEREQVPVTHVPATTPVNPGEGLWAGRGGAWTPLGVSRVPATGPSPRAVPTEPACWLRPMGTSADPKRCPAGEIQTPGRGRPRGTGPAAAFGAAPGPGYLQDLVPFPDALAVGRAPLLHARHEDAHVVPAGQPQPNALRLHEAHNPGVSAVPATGTARSAQW